MKEKKQSKQQSGESQAAAPEPFFPAPSPRFKLVLGWGWGWGAGLILPGRGEERALRPLQTPGSPVAIHENPSNQSAWVFSNELACAQLATNEAQRNVLVPRMFLTRMMMLCMYRKALVAPAGALLARAAIFSPFHLMAHKLTSKILWHTQKYVHFCQSNKKYV